MAGPVFFAFVLALFTTALVSPVKALAADTAPAMITPGKFGVGAAGAFTYDIPIAVPPGTAGMSPALSLDYSSQGGDGILGLGWVLGGFPSIARCPRTLAQDGIHGGINYDMNDRFCMDGQRLIVTSGTYGADGSQYRTEIDSFSLIIAHGSTGNGPTWFEVHTKSGEIMELGNTSDSRSPAVGKTTIRAWAVDKISDTVGNYYTITYQVDAANGVNYPLRIDYTGNAAASLSTYNSIRFVYESRADVAPFYQAGSLTEHNQLLKDVQTYAGATLVSDYQLTYQTATSTVHSQLTSIAQCDGSGACLPATTFGWQPTDHGPNTTTLPINNFQGHDGYTPFIQPGAFSGQGLTDLYVNNAGSCGIYYGTQSAGVFTSSTQMTATYTQYTYDPETGETVTPITNGPAPCPIVPFKLKSLIDISGDGLSDALVVQQIAHSQFALFSLINDGSNHLLQPNGGQGGVNAVSNPEPGDFNGDGLADVISSVGTATNNHIFLGDGTGIFNQSGAALPQANSYYPADFDGDGCTDILAIGLSGGSTSQVSFSCAPAVATMSTPALTTVQVVPGDFNGDGKTDLLLVPPTGDAQLYLSTGTSFAAPIDISGSSGWYNYDIETGDWNGDGRTDIMLFADGATGHNGVHTTHKFYLSTGSGFGSEWADIANDSSADQGATLKVVVADFNNDGAADVWIQKPSGDTEYMFSYVPQVINSVTNGIGVTTTITYDRLNHATLYTKESGDVYPTQNLNGPFYVVASISSSNGIGGVYNSSYAYTGAKTNLQGRGFLGFHTMAVTDTQTGVVQTTTYEQLFPYTGLVSSQTRTLNGVTLNSSVNSYAATASVPGTNAQFVYLTRTVANSTDLDGTTLPTVTTAYGTYDTYGNPEQITVTTGGSTKVTSNTYTNDTTNWFLGRLTQSSVTSTVGNSTITRTSSFAYDPGTGLLDKEIVEPATPALKLQTVYGFDSFGNKQTATVTGGSGASQIASRTTTTDFDTRGQFATTVINALNQSETWVYSPPFALATAHTGPNNLTTHWQYDTFGRPTLETRPDGTETTYSYLYCSGVNGGTATCPANGAFLVQTAMLGHDHVTQNGPTATTYYDALSRVIAHEVQGFDGTVIHTDSQYDAMGRPWRTSQPYFVGTGTAYWTTNVFDALGRPTKTTQPDTGVVTYTYDGLTTSVTDADTNTTTTVKNAQGLNASVTDANGKVTKYVYDAFGDLLTITDSAGNVTSAVYDTRGNRTTADDPDKGSWAYTYDALGELKTQTNANGNKATLYYDLLGRITRRAEVGLNSTWTYDTATNGIGSLAEADTNGGYSRVLTYDTHGRPSTTALSYGGNTGTYTTTYDTQSGKVAKVAYPSGLSVQYAYNTYGYLTQEQDAASGLVYWTVNARDQYLHAVTETAGSGVVTTHVYTARTGRVSAIRAGTSNAVANLTYAFDMVGNLLSRQDHDLSTTDQFTYDPLNRLSTYSIAGGAYQTIGYDSLGDIKTKPGVGTYHYPAAGQPQPHAVSSITGTVRGVTNPKFTYDGDGNQLSGPGVAVGYTAWDMPAWMSAEQGGTTWGSFNWGSGQWSFTGETFAYDSEHQRVEMAAQAGSTFYFNDPTSGGTAEYYVPASGAAQWRDYIVADGRMVAERTATVGGGAALQYFVADHLGSIAVVTDASGNVVQRMVYDPWGVQLASDGSQLCGAGPTTRGYTGEEQMPTGCLVNLNARIYDPILGRFMSGDPVTGDIFDAQSLNRYGYVLNNPLSMTDTNGECGVFCFVLFFGILDVATVEVLKPLFEHVPILGNLFVIASGIECGVLGGPSAGAFCAAEASGLIAGVTSGSVGKGLEAFALSYAESSAFNFVGGKLQAAHLAGLTGPSFTAAAVISHGLVGGTFSVLQGGSFGSGFLAAGVSELATPYITKSANGNLAIGAVESAVVGGTASAISGGKFGNGAITGAFGYLFNDACHGGGRNAPQCQLGTPAQNAANAQQFWTGMAILYGTVGFAFGGEIIEGAIGAWDLLVGGGEAASSDYIVTTGARAAAVNVETNVTADEAVATLEENGYRLTSTSGPSSTYTNASGDSYTLRPSNTAGGGQALDFRPAGGSSTTVKIKLGN